MAQQTKKLQVVEWGLNIFLFALGAAILMVVLDAFFQVWRPDRESDAYRTYLIAYTIVSDLRYVLEQLMVCGAILFAAGKFLDMRTTVTVGFDRLDAARMSVKGPDETNTVWIGQRFDTRVEAEAIAGAMEKRLEANDEAQKT